MVAFTFKPFLDHFKTVTNRSTHRDVVDTSRKIENERRTEMITFTFKTREEYLKWRAEWKADYKEISKEIRRLKNARKEYKWTYRAKGDDTSQKRIKIGANPDYDSSASWQVYSEKCKATRALETLKAAKAEAGRQRAARLELEKAA